MTDDLEALSSHTRATRTFSMVLWNDSDAPAELERFGVFGVFGPATVYPVVLGIEYADELAPR